MTTASTSLKTSQDVAIDNIVSTEPCHMVRLQKFASLNFFSDDLESFSGQKVFLDESIDYLNYKPQKKPISGNYLIIMIQAINPITHEIVQCCSQATCHDSQSTACRKCETDRATSAVIKANESFRNKLIHAKRIQTNEDTVVRNNSINIQMRVNCANVHQGLDSFTFFVEITNQKQEAQFRGVFRADVVHSQSGAMDSNCAIQLVKVA